MMKREILSIIFLVELRSGTLQFKNIRLTDVEPRNPNAENGLGISINTKRPDNIVAGISPGKIIYTKDGGLTWSETKLLADGGVGEFATLLSDSKGTHYFFHTSDLKNELICQKSSDEGTTWKAADPFGINSDKTQYRPAATVAHKKQSLFATWTQFDKYQSADTANHSNIMFSKSGSEGKKWSKPIQINQVPGDCLLGDNTAIGATTAVDFKGRVFVAWAYDGVIYFDRSFDGGNTWLHNDMLISKQEGGSVIDEVKSNGLSVLMIDNSPSRYHGSLYLVWADQTNGKNDTDIWFRRSGNGGDNWSSPFRVNKDEPGKHQFAPTMAVDQVTGNIYIAYYDRRNYTDMQTDVYMAYSTDGGNSFNEVKISETPFISNSILKQISIAANKGVIVPIWKRADGDKASIWTAIIKEVDLIKK